MSYFQTFHLLLATVNGGSYDFAFCANLVLWGVLDQSMSMSSCGSRACIFPGLGHTFGDPIFLGLPFVLVVVNLGNAVWLSKMTCHCGCCLRKTCAKSLF